MSNGADGSVPFGRDGAAVVDDVRDESLGRLVKRKMLATSAADAVARFALEARMTAQLEHPNIVPVYGYGVDGGVPFFTMRNVTGGRFDELLRGDPRARTPNDIHAPLEILMKVCEAVAYAHGKGFIHRDLKPQNIRVGEFGEVYLLDWGSAMRVDGEREPQGMFFGTPAYAAPEQARGDNMEIDARTDVFGIGAVLYHVLTHRPLYQLRDFGGSLRRLIAAAREGAIVPPDVVVDKGVMPEELVRICMRALEPERGARYATVEDLRRDLQLFVRSAWTFDKATFAPGADIVRQGDLGREAFIIISGHCDVWKDGVKLRPGKPLGPGAVFGETGALTGLPRTATVRAVDDVTVAVISFEAMRHKLGLDSWSGRLVLTLADRFRDADKDRSDLQRRVRELEDENRLLRGSTSRASPSHSK